MIDLAHARNELRRAELDGWLLYDFRGLNPLARQAAGIAPETFITRRWFCLIPADGEPRWLVHKIERVQFEGVPGTVTLYAERSELERGLAELAPRGKRIAMEYSPMANVPTASFVDAGTLELIRRTGVKIRSSGDLVQALLARWPARGRALHDEAARALEASVRRAFATIGERLRARCTPTELEIQRGIMADLDANGLVTNSPLIVAVNAHAADPHYAPGELPGHDAPIGAGDVVLVDVWAKKKDDRDAVYADMTFMGYVGETPPARVAEVWRTVAAARDAALERARRLAPGEPVFGYDVDRAARAVIEAAGFGPQFVHRTGHSLGPEDHYIGANMDDFETHDERRLELGTGFTIEPGIYLPGEFGMRSEIDVFVGPRGPEATTEIQKELVRIRAT